MSCLHRFRAVAVALALAMTTLHGARAQQGAVAIVGDSLSVGLAGALQSRSPHLPIVGYGVISSSLIRPSPVDWQLRIRDVASTAPRFVVVLIGMNDTDSSWDASYERAATSFLDPLRRAGIAFAVVAVPYTRDPVRNRDIDQVTLLFLKEEASPRSHAGSRRSQMFVTQSKPRIPSARQAA